MLQVKGTCFIFGDDINTDYIISSRRKKDTIDVNFLKQYIMEDIRPGFYKDHLKRTTIIVAGENFGCGSAMEVAAQVVRANNIPAILAKSFARSYFRNAINNGILPIETDTSYFHEMDLIQITMKDEDILVEDLSNGYTTTCRGVRKELADILSCGGLIEYMKRNQI